MSNKDAKEYVSSLAKDMQVLRTSSESLGRTFAELGGTSNKLWTIVARLSSGTGFWKLQARVRSFSNMFELYYKAQDKALENTMETLDANQKLAKSYENVKIKHAAFSHSFKSLTEADKEVMRDDEVFSTYYSTFNDEALAYRKTAITYLEANDSFERQMKKRNKRMKKMSKIPFKHQSWGEILLGGEGSKRRGGLGSIGSGIGAAGRGLKAGFKDSVALNAYQKNIAPGLSKAKEKISGTYYKIATNKTILDMKAYVGNMRLTRKIRKLIPKLDMMAKSFLQVVVKALMGFMIYIPLIILVFMALKMAFNPVKKWATKNQKLFTDIKDQIIDLFYILKRFFKAVWDGDIVKVLKIWFFEVIPAVAKLLFSVGKVIAKALYVIVKEIMKALYSLAKAIVNGVTNWFGNKTGLFASGGIVNTPLQIVGEKGPELVSMPRGSRVYSNAESQRMSGGNTIHVHVNGRVGASDSEIRDIANKVAREINLRMNRTGTTGTGF